MNSPIYKTKPNLQSLLCNFLQYIIPTYNSNIFLLVLYILEWWCFWFGLVLFLPGLYIRFSWGSFKTPDVPEENLSESPGVGHWKQHFQKILGIIPNATEFENHCSTI